MQNISIEELIAVVRFHLKKVHRSGGFHQFWLNLHRIPGVALVVHRIAGLDLKHMRRNIEETMEIFFRHVGLDYTYWMSEVSRSLNLSSMWQLNETERYYFERFLMKAGIFEVKYQTRRRGSEVHGSHDHGRVIPILFSFALSEF